MSKEERIVKVVLENLLDRRGIGHELREIEYDHPTIWEELVADLEKNVKKVLDA